MLDEDHGAAGPQHPDREMQLDTSIYRIFGQVEGAG